MAMIQGIDGSALLNAFRAGKQDRFTDMQRQAEMKAAQAKQQRDGAFSGLMAQYVGGSAPPSGGVPGMAFDKAFSPDAMTAIGGMDSGGAAPTAPTAMAQPPARAAHDPDILRKLVAIDPERAGQFLSAIKTMDETSLKQMQAKNDALGLAAHVLAQKPQQERGQMLQLLAPQLLAAGWTQQEIANANLTDDGLHAYQGMAIDYDKMIDNNLAEREFMAGKIVTPQPGAGAFRARPDGTIETIVAPNDGSHPVGSPVGGGAPKSSIPQSAQDYLRQHPELKGQFDQKYGAGASDAILGGGAGDGRGVMGYQLDNSTSPSTYGKRVDGTAKGTGFLGPLRRPDGGVSTEISVGVEIGGRETEIPLMVPGLSKPELDYLMTHDPSSPDFNRGMPRSILQKAVAHARQRMAQGKSPFAQSGEDTGGGAGNSVGGFQP